MPTAASGLFQEYERDYLLLHQAIEEALLVACGSDGLSSGELADVERKATTVDQLVRQMELESRSLAPEGRSELDPLLRRYRSEVVKKRKAIEEAKTEAARRSLLGDNGLEMGQSMKDRERLLNCNEDVQSSTRLLDQARVQALETEQVGLDIMSDLRSQRETILRSHANIGEVGTNAGIARRILDRMGRRAAANRMMTRVVVIGMCLLLLLATFWILRPASAPADDAPSTADASGSDNSHGGGDAEPPGPRGGGDGPVVALMHALRRL